MQRGLSYHKAVCLSVTRVYCDKTNKSSADIVIPYERSIILVFRHEEWLVHGGRPLLPEILGQTDHPRFKYGDLESTLWGKKNCTILFLQ